MCEASTFYLFIFSSVSDAREDGHSDSQVQQQDADLTVTVLQIQDGGKGNFKCLQGQKGIKKWITDISSLFSASPINKKTQCAVQHEIPTGSVVREPQS